VYLPKEHGSWSLALEPVALGLLVTPSLPGVALAASTAAAFLLRRPFKLALGSASQPPRPGARKVCVIVGGVSALALLVAAAFGGVAALWPLLLALPFGALFLYFDRQNEMRAAAAELSGSAAFAVLPAAFATLAGWATPAALALAAVMLARNVPTVLTVRTYLRSNKGGDATPVWPILAATIAFAGLLALGRLHLAPWTASVLGAVLLVRTLFFVTPLRPAWPARRVGFIEAGLGVAYVGLIALSWRMKG
jgi:hypothetical protein